jgi:HPt (histidine-containing phosphotransfer) domain-containing protein
VTVQEQMRDLLKRYCTKLFGQLEILEPLLSQSSNIDTQSSAMLARAQKITHEMKGTAGSLGYSDLAAAASALDDDLKLYAKQDRVPRPQLQISKELFARLRKIASQTTPQESALFDADLSRQAGAASSVVLSRCRAP